MKIYYNGKVLFYIVIFIHNITVLLYAYSDIKQNPTLINRLQNDSM